MACQVFDGAKRARHALMALRSGLEFVRQIITGRPHLVAEGVLEQLFTTPQDPLMRSEELVSGKHQEVATQILDIDAAMGRELHRIDIEEGASIMRLRSKALYIIDRAGAVGR